MGRPYHIWLHRAAYEYLESLGLAERQTLFVWLERIGSHPDRSGDFVEKAEDGRDWQVAILGLHAVVWWVDGPVREIKIVAIRAADA